MEIFELNYKYKDGERDKTTKVKATNRRGMYYIQLPGRKDESNGTFLEIVATDGVSWQYFSKKPNSPTISLRVWVNEDGTIQYENDGDGEKKTAEHKFDEHAENLDFPYDIAQKLYELKKQLDYIVDIQEKIKTVRRKRLDLRLKKLGYSSPRDVLLPLKDHSIYCDLNDIYEELIGYEDYIEIPGFSRRESVVVSGNTETDIIYSAPTPEGKSNIVALIQKITEEMKQEKTKIEEKEEMTDRKRSFIDGAGIMEKPLEFEMTFPGIMSMTEIDWKSYSAYITAECREFWPKDEPGKPLKKYEKMPKDKLKVPKAKPVQAPLLHNVVWNKYVRAISEIAKLYLGLNADILEPEVAKQVRDLTGVYGKECEEYRDGEELRTLIGELIDSDIFIEASNIEDIAICAMNLDFLRLVDSFFRGDGNNDIFGKLRDSILELNNDSIETITSRMAHVARFLHYQTDKKRIENITKIEISEPTSKKSSEDESPGGSPGGEVR